MCKSHNLYDDNSSRDACAQEWAEERAQERAEERAQERAEERAQERALEAEGFSSQ